MNDLWDDLMTMRLKLDDFREYNIDLFSKVQLHNYDMFVNGINEAIEQSKFLIKDIIDKRKKL